MSIILKHHKRNSGQLASLSDSNNDLNQSIHHLFTFQTLREVIASSDYQQNTRIKAVGQNKIQVKEKLKKYLNLNNGTDYNKLLRYLPALKNSEMNPRKSTFLNDGFKSSQKRVSKIKASDGAIENVKMEPEKNGLITENENIFKLKPEEIFKNELFHNSQVKHLGCVSEKPRKLAKVPSESLKNKGKLITVKLPKPKKSRYFPEKGNNSVIICKDDDLLIQGWEELGTFDY